VVIHCNDTDVHIIFLYHLGTGNIKANVWMDAGVDGNNTRHYVNISGLSKELGLICALPSLKHSFTGCDFTMAFLTTEIYGKIIYCTICKSRRIPTVTNISIYPPHPSSPTWFTDITALNEYDEDIL